MIWWEHIFKPTSTIHWDWRRVFCVVAVVASYWCLGPHHTYLQCSCVFLFGQTSFSFRWSKMRGWKHKQESLLWSACGCQTRDAIFWSAVAAVSKGAGAGQNLPNACDLFDLFLDEKIPRWPWEWEFQRLNQILVFTPGIILACLWNCYCGMGQHDWPPKNRRVHT